MLWASCPRKAQGGYFLKARRWALCVVEKCCCWGGTRIKWWKNRLWCVCVRHRPLRPHRHQQPKNSLARERKDRRKKRLLDDVSVLVRGAAGDVDDGARVAAVAAVAVAGGGEARPEEVLAERLLHKERVFCFFVGGGGVERARACGEGAVHDAHTWRAHAERDTKAKRTSVRTSIGTLRVSGTQKYTKTVITWGEGGMEGGGGREGVAAGEGKAAATDGAPGRALDSAGAVGHPIICGAPKPPPPQKKINTTNRPPIVFDIPKHQTAKK